MSRTGQIPGMLGRALRGLGCQVGRSCVTAELLLVVSEGWGGLELLLSGLTFPCTFPTVLLALVSPRLPGSAHGD